MAKRLNSSMFVASLLLFAGCQDSCSKQQKEESRKTLEVKVVAPVADPLSQRVSQKVHAQAMRRKALASGSLKGQSTPQPNYLPSCSKLQAADLDGDGNDEIICWNDGRLTFWDQTEERLNPLFSEHYDEGVMPGVPNVMAVADVTGDGDEEVLIAWGLSKTQPKVPITISQVDIVGESGGHRRDVSVLARLESPRPEVVALAYDSDQKQIYFAHFDSRYFVKLSTLKAESGQWALREEGYRRRMASSWQFSFLGANSYAIGRPYGNQKLEPGDLIIQQGQEQSKIQTHLGVRSVAAVQVEGPDSPASLAFADGWHYQYGEKATARLSLASRDSEGKWRTQLLGVLPNQYEVRQIEAVDLNGDGREELVVAGNESIHLASMKDGAWKMNKLAAGSHFTLAKLTLEDPWTLVVAGTPIQFLTLHDTQ